MKKRGNREQGTGDRGGTAIIVCVVLLSCFASRVTPQEILGTAENTLTVEGKGNSETLLGDFLSDAARDAANTDVSVLPAYALQFPLKNGNITMDVLHDLSNYGDDTLVILKVNGEVLKALFEQSVRLYSRENINFLHVSGLRVTFDPQKKPGERITLLEQRKIMFPLNLIAEFFIPEIQNAYHFYVKINPERVYTVSTLKFSAFGPMGYYKIFGDKQIIKVLPVTLHQALVRFVQKKKVLRYEMENRFIKIPPPPEEEKKEEETAENP